MNNRQKLVQKHFLNNEKAIIQRLQRIYGDSLKEIQDKIKNLSFSIGKLQQEYDWLDPSDPKRAEIKSMIQSKIYQKQYQAQLEKQVDGILKRIRVAQIDNIEDYLDTCYSDAFIGTIFDAHGQGVPILAPINQESMVRAVQLESMVRAVQLESKISKGLYTKLGQDVNLLKTRIMAEVSRGISTGKSYAQVAKGLENQSRIGFNRAVRIARTEGHRIQCTAAMDAMEAAKERGADVLKQWDSTLDGRTRDSHARVDGEIRELDKKFSNGLMFAGDPNGMAGEVINCRCAVLQRARWALDEDELQVLKDKARYFGLDKADEFDDFKKKYLKATNGLAAKIGGDGIPEHDEPILLKTIDYFDKNAVLETLTNFEKSAIMSEVETACVITKDGKVYKCFGIEDRVFPDFDLGEDLFGATVSHNHPISKTEHTFSDQDFGLFHQFNLDLLRGCDEKYTYELTRDATLIDDPPEDWQTFENYFHGQMILKAKEYGFGYRRWLNG